MFFLAERKIGAFIDKNHGPRGPKNQEPPSNPLLKEGAFEERRSK